MMSCFIDLFLFYFFIVVLYTVQQGYLTTKGPNEKKKQPLRREWVERIFFVYNRKTTTNEIAVLPLSLIFDHYIKCQYL